MSSARKRRQDRQWDDSPSEASLTEADKALFGEISERDSDSLAVRSDGSIHVGNFELTPIGLSIIAPISFDEWRELGGVLNRLDQSLQWLIGDWFVLAEQEWGKTYDEVAEITGYKVKTLYDYSYVSRAVDFSVRTEKLSFGHHKIVCRLEPEAQMQWLQYAVVNNLSVSQLRDAIRPTLPAETRPNPFDFAEKKREIGKFGKKVMKARQGDAKARREALGWIQEQKKWLEEVEGWLVDE